MKKQIIAFGILLLMLLTIVGCASAPATTAPNTAPAASNSALLPEVSLQDAAKLRDAGAFVLDVREPSEWNEFHIPGSTLISLGQLQSRVSEIPKDKQVLVVCRSGNRSRTGRDILKQAGFANVTSMNGGLTEWRNSGLPTVSGP